MSTSVLPDRQSREAVRDRLSAEITTLCGYLNAATFRLLELIREFDENRCWELPGLVSCAHWLNFQCGIGINAAREKVRVAHALIKLPEISEAFRRGEISYSKVRAMTRVATAENEAHLLMIARNGTAHHVEKLVRQCRRAERLSEAKAATAQFDARSVTYRYDEDGSLLIAARLPAEAGVLVIKALERAMDFRDGEERDADVTAETSAMIPEHPVKEVTAVTPQVEQDVSAVTRTPLSMKRADGLVDMAETYLDATPMAASSADRYQVMVHVGAHTLGNDALEDDVGAYIDDGPHLSEDTVRRLACDCSITRLVEDDKGEPLSIGRKSRSIPPAMRRALKVRDDGCRFPGCTHRRYVDGHHIDHWANGGETSLDNLIELCRHHHRLVHEGGFDCRRTIGGAIEFFDAAGKRIDRQPDVTVSIVEIDPVAWFESHTPDVDIDAATCVTLWAGEPMDYGMAAEGVMGQ